MNFFLQMRDSVIDFNFYKNIKDNRFGKSFFVLFLTIFNNIFYDGNKMVF